MKKIFIAFFVFTSLLSFAQEPQIVGGQAATKGEFPFVVGLGERFGSERNLEDHFCGGSLIAPNWVLTAAHCLYDENGNRISNTDLFAFINAWSKKNPNNTREIFDISQIIIHPNYNDESLDSDIALLKLSGSSTITPTNVVTQNDNTFLASGTKATIAGWGATDVGVTIFPDIMQKATVEVISTSLCNSRTWYDGEVNENMFCAGYENGEIDACSGDSGGPLFVTKDNTTTQIGVVSWGSECAAPKSPGVYTKVNKYTDWISTYVNLVSSVTSTHYWLRKNITFSTTQEHLGIQNESAEHLKVHIYTLLGQNYSQSTVLARSKGTVMLPTGLYVVSCENDLGEKFVEKIFISAN